MHVRDKAVATAAEKHSRALNADSSGEYRAKKYNRVLGKAPRCAPSPALPPARRQLPSEQSFSNVNRHGQGKDHAAPTGLWEKL